MKIFKILMLMLILPYSGWVSAHPPGLSSLDVSVAATQLAAKVTFALQDIEAFSPMDSDLDADVSDAEREAAKPAIAKLMAEQLRISVDNQQFAPTEQGRVTFDDQNNVHVELYYLTATIKQLQVESKVLALFPEGHQQYLTVRAVDGAVLLEKMLGKQDAQASVDMSVVASGEQSFSSIFAAFSDFFKLGVEHIVTGYDHLLFLFALLAVTHSFWPALKIITFFTVAHSITLAFAGLNQK